MKQLNKTTVGKENLPAKILQFGEGNFLRAFVDWMIDKANQQGVMNHGITIVQPIPQGEAVKTIFERQDCLYHVYLEGIKSKQPVKEISLVKSVNDIINPYSEYEKYRQAFLSDELELIVSNTTEAGIRYEDGDDLTAKPPKSFPAKITALLHERFRKFNGDPAKGLQIVCCELIEDNGSTLREFVLKHAAANNLSADFEKWLTQNCHFYDTLVDRIVPGFPKDTIDEVKAELGFDDNLVVKGEYFHVWAIGGDPIIREKLPLDKAGFNVLFMDDIRAFRAKKVRILNGAHTAMAQIGLLMGCETVREAFDTPIIEKFILQLVENEVLPAINEDQNELKAFAAKIVERFYNPYIKHYLRDISLNSLSKWETRDFPTVKDNFENLNRKTPLTTFSFAAMLVLYSGKSGANFEPRDTAEFVQFIQSSFNRNDIRGWVQKVVNNHEMWTVNLTSVPHFADDVAQYASAILHNGIEKSLIEILG